MGRRRAYALTAVAALTYTGLTFCWFTLPAYLPVISRELGLSGTEAGVVAGAVPLTYVPLAILSGLVVDRVGVGRSLACGLGLVGLAQLARTFTSGFPTLLAATVALGVGGTAITFGLPKLVSTLFAAGETGPPSSIYLLGASAGTAGAYALGRPLFGPALGGWRPLFFWSGAVALAYALAWALVALAYALAWALVARGLPRGESGGFDRGSLGRDLRVVLGSRPLRLVVVLGVVYLSVIHGLQGWLPTVLEARGLGSEAAGRTTSLLVAANAAGVLAVPTLADRYDARRAAVVCCGAAVSTGVAGIVAGGLGALLVGGVVLAGLGVGGLSPLVRAIPPELEGVGPRLTGVAVGVVFAGGEVGGFLGPVVVGALYDLTGTYAVGLGVLGAAGLAAVGAGLRLRV